MLQRSLLSTSVEQVSAFEVRQQIADEGREPGEGLVMLPPLLLPWGFCTGWPCTRWGCLASAGRGEVWGVNLQRACGGVRLREQHGCRRSAWCQAAEKECASKGLRKDTVGCDFFGSWFCETPTVSLKAGDDYLKMVDVGDANRN